MRISDVHRQMREHDLLPVEKLNGKRGEKVNKGVARQWRINKREDAEARNVNTPHSRKATTRRVETLKAEALAKLEQFVSNSKAERNARVGARGPGRRSVRKQTALPS
jgi:hypothetical protein